jgi:predicted lysophospholipase L1 biosynthesis ABC-type transport system permease subunit
MRIVGTAIFPESGDATGHLDDGAQITFNALHALAPNAEANIVRFGVDPAAGTDRTVDQIRTAVAPLQLLRAQAPTTITSFGRTNNLPAIVAVIMAVVATATLAHAMIVSVRRRSRDFAILESIGLTRRQRSVVVIASSATLAFATAVIGIPLGIATGRWAWHTTAHALGVPAPPVLDLASIALAVLGLFAVAIVVALVPAAIARRAHAAGALRAE